MKIDSLLDNLRWDNLESILKEMLIQKNKTEDKFIQHPVTYEKDYPVFLIPQIIDLIVDHAIQSKQTSFSERGVNFLSLQHTLDLVLQNLPVTRNRLVERLYYLTHENSGDLSYDHIESHQESLVGINDLGKLYEMISKTYMSEEEKTQQAITWYKEGLPCSCSTFIDEVTMTYGYGNLGSMGDWEYEIPHSELSRGEAKTVKELMNKASDKKGTRD